MSHLKAFDRIIPAAVQAEPAKHQAARHLALLAGITAISAPLLTAMYHWLGFNAAGTVVLTGGIAMMVAPFALNAGLGLAVARDIFVGSLFLLKVWLALHLGGLEAPTVPWFLLCPAIAMLLGGMRPGLIWGLVVTLTVSALFVVDRSGMLVAHEVSDPLVLELVSLVGLFILSTILMALARDAAAVDRRSR